jgi:hypothetical protein
MQFENMTQEFIRLAVASLPKRRVAVAASSWRANKIAVLGVPKRCVAVAASSWRANKIAVLGVRKRCAAVAASSWLAVPICVIVSVGVVYCFYFKENASGGGEPFAWFDGISAWPSIAIILFAGLLSIHLIAKAHFELRKNADKLAKKFGLSASKQKKTCFFGWEVAPLKPGIPREITVFPGLDFNTKKRIDIKALWKIYLCRGRFWRRLLRVTPMFAIYIIALIVALPVIGPTPTAPIRGQFNFILLIAFTIFAFLFLTFFVIDAILLHEGFLLQLEKAETYWPDLTFQKLNYPFRPKRPSSESDLADYWDILLISKRTEVVGRLIYYPFFILSLIIVARLNCFDDWTLTPVLVVALSMHFSLALYGAWRLPYVAKKYRDKVLERLKRRRRQALMLAQKMPEAIDTMIEEVQSTHQGAFSYLWEQPAIRALLLPSSGIGLATLLQYLPR